MEAVSLIMAMIYQLTNLTQALTSWYVKTENGHIWRWADAFQYHRQNSIPLPMNKGQRPA